MVPGCLGAPASGVPVGLHAAPPHLQVDGWAGNTASSPKGPLGTVRRVLLSGGPEGAGMGELGDEKGVPGSGH